MRKGAYRPPVASSQDTRPEKPREAITLSESPENTYVQNTLSQRRDSEKPPQATDYGLDRPQETLVPERRGEKKRVRSSATIQSFAPSTSSAILPKSGKTLQVRSSAKKTDLRESAGDLRGLSRDGSGTAEHDSGEGQRHHKIRILRKKQDNRKSIHKRADAFLGRGTELVKTTTHHH